MAERIAYTPTPSPADPVAEQTADLMEALAETGLLRAVTGAVRAYPDLLGSLVQSLDAEKLRALATLGGLGDILGAEGMAQVVHGITAAAAAADHATSQDPPSLPTLVRQLVDPDVRRALSAVVAGLGAFGNELARD